VLTRKGHSLTFLINLILIYVRTYLPNHSKTLRALLFRPLLLALFSMTANLLVGQCQPFFLSSGENITVSCGEELPELSDCEAASNCCDGPVTVSSFTSETGAILHDCIISTANGPGVDWAIWLPMIDAPSVAWNFTGTGHFQTYADGTAHVWGIVANAGDASLQLEVEMWLENGLDWQAWSALGRNYKNDLGFAGSNYTDWHYYELVAGFSRLTGIGELEGTFLELHHQPADYFYGFQMGIGANNKNGNDGMSGWFTYDGLYGGETVSGHGDINVDQDCEEGPEGCATSAFTRICRADDSCGNTAFNEQTVSVSDTEAPVLNAYESLITVECIEADGIFVSAIDECSTVVITYVDEVIVAGCPGQVIRHYNVADACGNFVTADQTINILSEGELEFTVFPANQNVECDEVEQLDPQVEWNSVCANTILTISENLIPGECPNNYVIEYTYTLNDACGNEVSQVWVVTVSDNTKPVFFDVPANITLNCGDEIPQALPTAVDNCGEVNITLNAITEELECGYNFIRTWTAEDACGNTETATQVIYISDEIDPFYTFIPQSVTVSCGEPFSLDLAIVEDQCSYVELTWTDVPLGDCAGSYMRLWRAFDGCGNQALESTIVTLVDNQAPVMTTFPENVEVSCGDIPTVESVQIEYEDFCTAVTVDFEETISEGDCASGYTIVRTWVLTDGCGNSSEWIWTISVNDNQAPILVGVPDDTEMSCGDDVSDAVVVAIDNCDQEVTVSLEATTEPSDCGYLFIRTWTATDDCGNTVSDSQIIAVNDEADPVFTFVPDDIAISCGDGISIDELPLAEASDDCSVVDVTYVDQAIGGNCGDGLIRTFTATDGCGNTVTAEQLISFSDEIPPVFTFVPASQSLDCNGGATEIQMATAIDNCSEPTITFEDEFTAGGCAGGYIRHWIATDACGNFVTADQEITSSDQSAPVITNFPIDITVSCDQVPTPEDGDVEYTDDCGNVTTVYSENVIEGNCPNSYTIERTWTFTDGCGNSVSDTWTIFVVDESAPIVIGVPTNTTINCGEEVEEAVINAIDNCSAPENITISLSAVTTPGDCGSEFIRTWTVSDECGNTTVESQVVIILDNEAPVFTFVPTNINVVCGQEYELLDAVATDNCSAVTVTAEILEGSTCLGGLVRVFTATDGCGNSTTAEQIISIVDETAPVAVNPPPAVQFFNCDDFLEVTASYVEFTDDCSNVDVIFDQGVLPSDCPGTYSIVYTWTAIDDCGNMDFQTMEVFYVDQTAPEFVTIADDLFLECGQPIPSENISATDDCSEVTITVDDEELNSGCASQLLRTYTATDDCGNWTSFTQLITFVDVTAPSFSFLPPDITVSCTDAVPTVVIPEAIDDCSLADVTYSETEEAGDCPSNYTIIREFVATDFCGNEATHTQTISVVDEQGPIFENFESQITLNCGESNGVFVTASDDCNSLDMTFSDELLIAGCGGAILRTYTATDACGNASQVTQQINLIDEQQPEFLSFPESGNLECDQVPTVDEMVVEFIDNCSEVSVDFSENIIPGECPNDYIIERTWIIADECGNENSQTWTAIVSDNQAPQIIGVPDDAIIDCGDVIPSVAVFAFDNCTAEPVIALTATQEQIGCNTIFTRRWTAEDECGNLSQAIQVITISDFYNPSLSEYPGDIVLVCGDDVPAAPEITAEDNCATDLLVDFTETTEGDPTCPTIIREWCASDCVGNTVCHTQTIFFDLAAGGLTDGGPQMQAWQQSADKAIVKVTPDQAGRWGIDVYDVNGKVVVSLFAGEMTEGVTKQFDLDITGIEDGTYYVRFTNGKEQVAKGIAIIR